MLVMLESDLSRQGISTTAKGLCASCQKPIAGQVSTIWGEGKAPGQFGNTEIQAEMGGTAAVRFCRHTYKLVTSKCLQAFCLQSMLKNVFEVLGDGDKV